jgi:hypothetical protein
VRLKTFVDVCGSVRGLYIDVNCGGVQSPLFGSNMMVTHLLHRNSLHQLRTPLFGRNMMVTHPLHRNSLHLTSAPDLDGLKSETSEQDRACSQTRPFAICLIRSKIGPIIPPPRDRDHWQ